MSGAGGRRENAGGPRYRLARDVRLAARALRAQGDKYVVIALELGISITAAWRACNQP